MEPLTGQDVYSAQTEVLEAVAAKKMSKAPERVSLSEAETKKLDHWIGLAREASKGFLTLSRSELVSFLVGEHRMELSPGEIKRLRAIHYDPIKHIQWIMPQIKTALTLGDVNRVAELQGELRGVELSIVPAATLDTATTDKSIAENPTPKYKKRSKKLDQNELVTSSEKAENTD